MTTHRIEIIDSDSEDVIQIPESNNTNKPNIINNNNSTKEIKKKPRTTKTSVSINSENDLHRYLKQFLLLTTTSFSNPNTTSIFEKLKEVLNRNNEILNRILLHLMEPDTLHLLIMGIEKLVNYNNNNSNNNNNNNDEYKNEMKEWLNWLIESGRCPSLQLMGSLMSTNQREDVVVIIDGIYSNNNNNNEEDENNELKDKIRLAYGF